MARQDDVVRVRCQQVHIAIWTRRAAAAASTADRPALHDGLARSTRDTNSLISSLVGYVVLLLLLLLQPRSNHRSVLIITPVAHTPASALCSSNEHNDWWFLQL